MKVLVLGGCGFIGSYVVDELIAQHHEVRVFDQRPERFRPPNSAVEYIYGDFGSRAALIEALTGVQIVVHLVSSTFPSTGNINPQADVADNLVNTLNLFRAMIDLGIRRILYASSGGTVYGIPETTPIPEIHPFRPVNSYGIVKAAIEQYLEMYRREGQLSPVVIRPANPYGPRQMHIGVQGVITTYMKHALEGKPVEIWGDGSVVRDYFHVQDLAKLCVAAATSNEEGPFNAGSGTGVSLNELIVAISSATGVQLETVSRPSRTITIPTAVLDISRARHTFGWMTTIALRDGLQSYCAWMRTQL